MDIFAHRMSEKWNYKYSYIQTQKIGTNKITFTILFERNEITFPLQWKTNNL